MGVIRTIKQGFLYDNGRGDVLEFTGINQTIEAEKLTTFSTWVAQSDDGEPTGIKIDISRLKMFLAWYIPDNSGDTASMRLDTNSASVPVDTFSVGPNKPVLWTPEMNTPNLFSADVTNIFWTSGGGGKEGDLNIEILEDLSEV